MTEKPHSARNEEGSRLTEGDWQAVHEHLRENVWGPANEEAEKTLKELGVAGRNLLAGLPGIPVYELGRCLQDMADGKPAAPSGDEFGRRLVDLLLLGQLDSDASAALAEFLVVEANAARVVERSRAADGQAQIAEEVYDESSWDVPLYDDNLHSMELIHLGHRWQLSAMEAAFWSVLGDQPGDRFKRLAEIARSFQAKAGKYEKFLAETSPEADAETGE